MGWKLSSIIIRPSSDILYEDLLNKLGYKNLTSIDSQPFDVAMYPENDKIYLGRYKGNLIICADNLPLDFLDENLSSREQVLIDSFPKAEICALSLLSTINHFAFALIKDGKKVRIKGGDAEIGTAIDFGQPLEEEVALLSKSKTNDKGERVYFLNDSQALPYL